MLFIDGLSFIELDPYWTYYILYKKSYISSVKEHAYSVVGYATTYEFWKNEEECRTRISQFLILPPYQKQGFGTILLDVKLLAKL
jgi:histone acetyltransferase 1